MFYSQSSIKKPKKQFNLLHLEPNELYILSLGVSLIVDTTHEEIPGKLHLCSRSLVFDPANISLPLIKMNFSQNIALKLIKSVTSQKLSALLDTLTPVAQLNETKLEQEVLAAKAQLLSARSKSPQRGSIDPTKQANLKTKGDLMHRLYILRDLKDKSKASTQPQLQQNPTSSINLFEDIVMNAIFIQIDMIFVTYRNLISPYIKEVVRISSPLKSSFVQQNSENIIFSLDKNNTKDQIIRFLKFYDGFIRTKEEITHISQIIENSVTQSIKDYVDSKKTQSKSSSPNLVSKAMRVTLEGNIYGFWACSASNLVFCPVINSIDQKILEFNLTDVKGFLKYRYLMKHTAVELWFYNKKRSLLIVFDDNETQLKVVEFLKANCKKVQVSGNVDLEETQRLWINNTYPVFPWVIQDYKTTTFDLKNPEFFRDLSKPIGAINKLRLQKLKDFYTDILQEKYKGAEGYLYPTHYSSPGVVVYFLIRKIPEFVIKLQQAVFGPSDRVFRGLESTWQTTQSLDADFKELIPEFYYSDGDFLVNNERLDFGVSQEGEIIDDVVLPNWANSVPDFMQKMKLALESDYVSQNLHKWVDLIFGAKQKGDAAKKSNNLFYPLTYEHNINWKKYESIYEKAAMETQVQELGQCPVILFSKPHPQKKELQKLSSNTQEQLNVVLQKYEGLKNENTNMKGQLDTAKEKLQQLAQSEVQQKAAQALVNELSAKIKFLSVQNENLKQFIRGFQEKTDHENSVSSQFLQTVDDQSIQPIHENDFDFLNETGNSAI